MFSLFFYQCVFFEIFGQLDSLIILSHSSTLQFNDFNKYSSALLLQVHIHFLFFYQFLFSNFSAISQLSQFNTFGRSSFISSSFFYFNTFFYSSIENCRHLASAMILNHAFTTLLNILDKLTTSITKPTSILFFSKC